MSYSVVLLFLKEIQLSNNDRHVLPNLFIIGAMKAGTTSLYHYMSAHSDVYMSPVKEPDFFAGDVPVLRDSSKYFNSGYRLEAYLNNPEKELLHSAHITTMEQYGKLFAEGRDYPVRGEASPSYINSAIAPQRIFDTIPGAKIIAVLRNPVDRARSHHAMDTAIGRCTESFIRVMRREIDRYKNNELNRFGYVGAGLYADNLQKFYSLFGAANVKVILFDDLKSKRNDILIEIAEFLGIDFGKFDVNKLDAEHNITIQPKLGKLNYVLNQSGIKRLAGNFLSGSLKQYLKKLYYEPQKKEKLDSGEYAKLISVFKDDMMRVGELTGYDLSHWFKGDT